jgi:fatty acid desaturase
MFASIALAVCWAALAVVFGAYAMVRGSVGAFVLTLLLIWLTHLAWADAWSPRDDDDHPDRPDVPFRF